MEVLNFQSWFDLVLESTAFFENCRVSIELPDRTEIGKIVPIANGRETVALLICAHASSNSVDSISLKAIPNRICPGNSMHLPIEDHPAEDVEYVVRAVVDPNFKHSELIFRGFLPKASRQDIAKRREDEIRLIEMYSHRAFEGLPNFHTERRPTELPSIEAIDFDYRRFFDSIAFAIEQWHSSEWNADFLVFESDSGGYVQLNRDDESTLIIAESMSELFKAKSEIESVADHAAIAYSLGWRSDDRMANDFAVFAMPTPLHRVGLAHWVIRSMTKLHGLSETSELVITNSDIDMAFEETRTIRIVKQESLDSIADDNEDESED